MAPSERVHAGVVGHVDDASDAGRAFLEHSYLTYIIPHTTEFDCEKPLQPGEDSYRDKFSGVEQRDMLFFGMRFALCPSLLVFPCSSAPCL